MSEKHTKLWRLVATGPAALRSEWLVSEEEFADGLAEWAEMKRAPESAKIRCGEIHEGDRNAALAILAGTMRRRGMSPEAREAALMQENMALCKPPLPASEVWEIARSVARYPLGEPEPGTSQPEQREGHYE